MPEVLSPDSGTEAAVDAKALAERAEGRANLYFLLATLFLEAPGAQALEKLKSVEMTSVMDEAGLTLGTELLEAPTSQLVELLAVEFTRLFLFSPQGRLAPYESLQRTKASGLLKGPESDQVSAYIEAAGFDYSSQFQEMPDHLSVQLEFLAHLCHEESTAWETGNVSAANNAIEFQRDFFNSFLGTWVFRFMEKVQAKSEMEFYRGLATFAVEFLQEEQSAFNHAVHPPPAGP